MSKAAWKRHLAVLERADTSSRTGFNAYWAAVAAILKGALWQHEPGLGSERQFIRQYLDEPARRVRRLAHLAAHGEAWPYRNARPSALRALAKNVEQHVRVGTVDPARTPVVYGRGRNLRSTARPEAPAGVLRRETRRLRRMRDEGRRHGELVVLLHGLGRTRHSMRRLEKALVANGFHAERIGYRSTSADTSELADRVWGHVAPVAGQFEQVHFVTHSMGGILTRRILERHAPENLGRVVMLAPPNQGSEVVDNLGQSGFVRWVMGPAFCELGTGPDGPRSLGPMTVPTLVIAGTKTQWPLSRYFDGVNDGKVSLESAAGCPRCPRPARGSGPWP